MHVIKREKWVKRKEEYMLKVKKSIRDYLEEYDKKNMFVPLTYDKFFKMVMKNNVDIFKDFLVRVLDLDEYIKSNYILFLDNDLISEHIKEHGKVVDINVKIGDNLIIDVELNTELYSTIKDRNNLYLERLDINTYKVKDKYSKIKDKKIYQLNLNANPNESKRKGKSIIVEYDILHNKVFDDRKKKFNLTLAYYYNKWYNGVKEMTYEEYILAALFSKSYVEMYDILSNILSSDRLDKLMGGIIKMIEDNDNFILHEWMKDKFDEMIAENNKIASIEFGKIEMIQGLLKQGVSYEVISNATEKSIEDIKLIDSEDFDKAEYIDKMING